MGLNPHTAPLALTDLAGDVAVDPAVSVASDRVPFKPHDEEN